MAMYVDGRVCGRRANVEEAVLLVPRVVGTLGLGLGNFSFTPCQPARRFDAQQLRQVVQCKFS